MTKPTIASPSKLAHFVLRTPQYETLIAWWRNVLGAEVRFGSPFITFLAYDDEHHRMAIVNQPQLTDLDATKGGVDHLAFTYGELDTLLETWERLKADGVEPYWAINHGPTTSLYYRDPDGNQVELQYDNFDEEEATAFFHSETFAANPIGVPFDPEKLLAKLRAGETIEELVEQGSTAD